MSPSVPAPIDVGRLNGDATWWVRLGGQRVVFDPWLVGSEIDYFRWFNEAWHTDPVVEPSAAGTFDIAIVSQHYADHCHPSTLAELDAGLLAAVPGCPLPGASIIPSFDAPPLTLGALRLWRLTRPWWHPPRYHAIVVADSDDRAVVHAPHGLPGPVAATIAERFDVALMAVSRARYRLPVFLGGAVNPGNAAALEAVTSAKATAALAIHDEAKRSEGVVGRLADIDRGPWEESGIPWLDLAVGTTLRLS